MGGKPAASRIRALLGLLDTMRYILYQCTNPCVPPDGCFTHWGEAPWEAVCHASNRTVLVKDSVFSRLPEIPLGRLWGHGLAV